MTPDEQPKPGDLIADRYRVVGELGTGGMGSVFRVQHTMMDKEMAMKLLRPELSGIAEVSERFEREAKSAARLDHPHIVRVTDFGKTAQGVLFLVMELLEGASLSTHFKEHGRLDVGEAIYLVDQILEALAHAHDNDVIHRDLKPDNVMLVEKDGRRLVKLLDFGLAKITHSAMQEGQQITTAGTVFGTPRYMSPEQASAEPADHRADLYSVGVMLFELLTGRAPFVADTTVDVLRMHLTHDPPALEIPGMAAPHVAALSKVINKALAKLPEDRFQSAEAFRNALADCATGNDPTFVAKETAMSRPPSLPPAPAPARRGLGLIAGAGLGFVGMIAVGAMLFSGGVGGSDIEDALDAGDTKRAASMLDRASVEDPGSLDVALYRGHIAFLDGKMKKAHASYQKSLRAGKSGALDERLERNILALVQTEPKKARIFVELLAEEGGEASTDLLTRIFDETTSPDLRRRAYLGLQTRDELDEPDDLVGALIQDLSAQRTKNCRQRKWYVQQLSDQSDSRILGALEAERDRKGSVARETFGKIFGTGVNACMGRLLEQEIEKRR